MDEELEKELQRTYTYHFFFVEGIYENIWHIRDFVDATNDFLERKLSPDDKDFIPEESDPRFNTEKQFGVVFPIILWRTTFLHSYFLLESNLEQVCKNVCEAEDLKLALEDISGNGIRRSATYLKKVWGVMYGNVYSTLVELGTYLFTQME
jgi:hypothetical protein